MTTVVSSARHLPNLGWDPTPGDVTATVANGHSLVGIGASMTSLVDELERADDGCWRGRAADAFREVAGELRTLLDAASTSFTAAGRVLYAWSDELAALQAETTRLEEEMGTALAELAACQTAAADDLAALDAPVARATRVWSPPLPPVAPGSPIRPDLMNEPAYWTNPDLVAARAAVDVVSTLRQRAEDLHQRYVDQATVYARRIDRAGEDIPRNPAFWNGIGDWFSDRWDDWDDTVGKRVRFSAGFIDAVSDISGVVGVVAGVAALFPPLALIAGAVSVGTAPVSIIGNSALAIHADGEWRGVLLDAAGVGLGKTASKVADKITDTYIATGRSDELVTVRSLTGDQVRVAPGLFRAKTMQGNEVYWRLASVKVTQAGLAVTVVQGDSLSKEYLIRERSEEPWDTPGYAGMATVSVNPIQQESPP